MRGNGSGRKGTGRIIVLASAVVACAIAGPVLAQDVTLSAEEVAALRAELKALKAEAAERARRIDQLEQKLDAALGPEPSTAAAVVSSPPPVAAPTPSTVAAASALRAPTPATAAVRAGPEGDKAVATAEATPPPAPATAPPPRETAEAQYADAATSPDEAPMPAPPHEPPLDEIATPALVLARQEEPEAALADEDERRRWPAYEPGKGFLLVQDEADGELGMGMYSYARYLNQNGLNPTYVDSFGRTLPVERNQSFQFQKVSMNLKGWLFDPRFRYYYFFWTANPNMGEGAQVVIGGYFQYKFDDALTVTAGVMPVPTTRSTNYTFPNWLRNDNRVMADEFFRGSYSTGIDAAGEILPRLHYRVALTNNLAQLGISAAQLNNGLDTASGAVWWMPTTGEFGPSNGFGDYEEHQKVATLFGAHYTQSTETAQEQPGVNTIENSQIRLSDGTLLFSPNAFNTGASITQADYHMAAVNAAVKYRGAYAEAEYYWRWVDDFQVTGGAIPVTELYDHGYTLRGSVMFVPRRLQGYVTGSHIFGEYGDPSEIALGLNWYPFQRKEVRLNAQALWLDHSPIGSNVLVAQVGGDGWVFNTDIIVNF